MVGFLKGKDYKCSGHRATPVTEFLSEDRIRAVGITGSDFGVYEITDKHGVSSMMRASLAAYREVKKRVQNAEPEMLFVESDMDPTIQITTLKATDETTTRKGSVKLTITAWRAECLKTDRREGIYFIDLEGKIRVGKQDLEVNGLYDINEPRELTDVMLRILGEDE